MKYTHYLLEELKRRVFILLFFLIILLIVSFFIKEISITKISVITLLVFILLCSALAALIRYFNNGKDIWNNHV